MKEKKETAIKSKKKWSKEETSSSWRIFKIMSEFVDGFESLDKIGPCISIFGSARTPTVAEQRGPCGSRSGRKLQSIYPDDWTGKSRQG